MPQTLTTGKKIAFSLIPVVVLLLAAELGLRLVGVKRPARPVLVARNIDVDVTFPFIVST